MRTAAATLVMLLGLAAPAHGYRLEHTRWYSRTITYYTSVPRYVPAVAAAARTWNTSGARVSRRRARVLITASSHIPGAGQASFVARGGIVRRARIGLLPDVAEDLPSPVAKRAVETAAVAHEMGHVLGLAHEQRRCTTMNAVLWEKCDRPPQPWQVRCRIVTADDVRGVIRIYGGRLRRVGTLYCDQEPAPRPPAGFSATLTNRAAHLAWTMPPVPPGQSVLVLRRQDTCP